MEHLSRCKTSISFISCVKAGGNSPSSYVAQRSYGRCGGRVHGCMSLYLLSVWYPANPRTGLPFIMSCHAFSRVGEQGQVKQCCVAGGHIWRFCMSRLFWKHGDAPGCRCIAGGRMRRFYVSRQFGTSVMHLNAVA